MHLHARVDRIGIVALGEEKKMQFDAAVEQRTNRVRHDALGAAGSHMEDHQRDPLAFRGGCTIAGFVRAFRRV